MLLPALALSLACSSKLPPSDVSDAAFGIAVLGDRSGEPNDAAWNRVIDQALARGPDLVLTVGDMADDAEDLADWKRALAPLSDVAVEVQYTPGNHDIHDDATADTFREQTGQEPYRSFERGGARWIVVDNSIAGSWEELPPRQQKWLEQTLKQRSELPTVVLMHKPFWALRAAADREDPMHDLFVAGGVDVVLTGHWHRHAYQQIDGIEYVIVGSSGGGTPGLPDPSQGNAYEFLWISAEAGELRMTSVVQGEDRPVDAFTLADNHLLRQLETQAVRGTFVDDDAGSRIEVSVANLTDEDFDTTIEIVGDWGVDPLPMPVRAGATLEVTLTAQPPDALLPLPYLRLDYPMPDGSLRPCSVPLDHRRLASMSRRPEPPTLDGDLSDWPAEPTVDVWTTNLGRIATAEATELYLSYDDGALYLAARNHDSVPEQIKRLHRGRDGQIVYDDRIGMILSPDPKQMFWFYVNPTGHVWDLHYDGDAGELHRDWDDVEAAARVDEAGWTAEAAIRWSDLGLEAPPETLRFDARRKQERTQSQAVFTPAFWASNPERMGILVLEDSPD